MTRRALSCSPPLRAAAPAFDACGGSSGPAAQPALAATGKAAIAAGVRRIYATALDSIWALRRRAGL
ncbi:hypothetical protein [Sorangium sp. So ce363]|uniref:hypothetical protein n=1 Tax=Sorangium sp. So ce363 TaxID=3133304 RepID=UPI003F63D8B3